MPKNVFRRSRHQYFIYLKEVVAASSIVPQDEKQELLSFLDKQLDVIKEKRLHQRIKQHYKIQERRNIYKDIILEELTDQYKTLDEIYFGLEQENGIEISKMELSKCLNDFADAGVIDKQQKWIKGKKLRTYRLSDEMIEEVKRIWQQNQGE